MLSDEEKKAIEILKDREYDFDELYCTFRQSFIKPYDKSIGIILELIEKQQKEIVHWKAGMKIIEKDKNNHIERLERRIEELNSENEVLEEIKISYEKKTDKLLKEKVKKEKEIEELKDDRKKYAEEYIHNNPWLYKQLNENYILRVESEQRERGAYIKGTNDADELCNKKWEYKIKAKIEVLEKLQKEFPNNDEIRIKIIAYKELLEKGVDIC